MREFIYLDISGPTASFKVPQVYQGFLLSLPLPPYSTILGMLSRMAGREITPSDTGVGIRYTFEGVGKDLETYHRWERLESGKYTYSSTAVRSREVHYMPHLQVVLDNTDLLEELESPTQIPTLGRSQDIATLNEIKVLEGQAVGKEAVQHTFIPLETMGRSIVNGMLYNIPEYFDYTKGMVRMPMNIRRFLAIGDNSIPAELPNLFVIKDQVFYIHNWR